MSEEITRALERASRGDPLGATELLPLVYDQLRRVAAEKMSRQPPGETLQATALVHEAWLKLTGSRKKEWQGREHFFAAAAEAMRHILVDRSRRKRAARHGGGQERVDFTELEVPSITESETVLALNEALSEFESVEPLKAQVVKLRYFIGLSERETGEILRLSERTVERYWAYAQAWLFERIERER